MKPKRKRAIDLITFCATPKTAEEISKAGLRGLMGGTVRTLISSDHIVLGHREGVFTYAASGKAYEPKPRGRPVLRKLLLKGDQVYELDKFIDSLPDSQAEQLKEIVYGPLDNGQEENTEGQ